MSLHCASLLLTLVVASIRSLLAALCFPLTLLLLVADAAESADAAGASGEEHARSGAVQDDPTAQDNATESDASASKSSADATRDPSDASAPAVPTHHLVSSVYSAKEIGIDPGDDYGCAIERQRVNSISALLADDTSIDVDNESTSASFPVFDADASAFLASGDLHVDWELDSIASSSSSLNDTDFLLGGESYDSDEEFNADEDLYLRGWSSDLESVCSSLNDTDYFLGGESFDSMDETDVDDSASECASLLEDSICILEADDPDAELDEVDLLVIQDDKASVIEQQLAAESVSTKTVNCDMDALAVSTGSVIASRGSLKRSVERNTAASTSLAAATSTAAASQSVISMRRTNAHATAAAGPKSAAVALQYNTNPRYLARSEESLARIQANAEKSALAKPRFLTHGSALP